MPIWFEGWPHEPEPDSQELRFLNMVLLDQVRSDANAWFAAQYEVDAARHAVAEERGAELAGAICWDLEEDASTHPAAPTLRTALTRLVFAFTNPIDRDDTVENVPLMELVADLYNEQGPAGADVNIQKLANHLDMRSIHIYVCHQHLISEGVLPEDMPMNERFIIARDYTPLHFDPVAGEEGGQQE